MSSLPSSFPPPSREQGNFDDLADAAQSSEQAVARNQDVAQTSWWSIYRPSNIPCFRQSILTGIGGGVGVGVVATLVTARLGSFPNFAIPSFGVIASLNWFICRYNTKVKKQGTIQLMNKQIDDLNKKAKEKLGGEYVPAPIISIDDIDKEKGF